jgi:hypothetical protein
LEYSKKGCDNMSDSERIAALDELFLEVGKYHYTRDYKELLDFIKRFPRVAPFNAMLVHVQRPGSTFFAKADYWYSIGRKIRPGANPIVILKPFGPVEFVFDAGDTIGDKPLPEEVIHPFANSGIRITAEQLEHFVESIRADGVLVYTAKHGTQQAGYIQRDSKFGDYDLIPVRRGKTIYHVKHYFSLVINEDLDPSEIFATMAHELGHLYCGHLGTPNEKLWKDRSRLDTNQIEFEAESVCWLVCERLGIKNPSAEYLSGYTGKDGKIPDISVDTVLKAVGIIEAELETLKKPPKELTIDKESLFDRS